MTYLTIDEINSNAKFAPLGYDNKQSFIYRLDKETISFKCSILLNYVKSKWNPEKIKTQEALKKVSEKCNIKFFELYEFMVKYWGDSKIPDYFDTEPSYHDEYNDEETFTQYVPAYGECSRRLGKTAESRKAVNKIWYKLIIELLEGGYCDTSLRFKDTEQIIDLNDMNEMLNDVVPYWSEEYKNLN